MILAEPGAAVGAYRYSGDLPPKFRGVAIGTEVFDPSAPGRPVREPPKRMESPSGGANACNRGRQIRQPRVQTGGPGFVHPFAHTRRRAASQAGCRPKPPALVILQTGSRCRRTQPARRYGCRQHAHLLRTASGRAALSSLRPRPSLLAGNVAIRNPCRRRNNHPQQCGKGRDPSTVPHGQPAGSLRPPCTH
jgi:hypothetical protein